MSCRLHPPSLILFLEGKDQEIKTMKRIFAFNIYADGAGLAWMRLIQKSFEIAGYDEKKRARLRSALSNDDQ